MTGRGDPSALRWLIGVELANFRKPTGYSLSEVAEATGITKPKLGHMESGRYAQHPEDIITLLRFFDAEQRDIDRLTSLSGRSDEKTWWASWAHVLPDWFRTFVGLEGLAAAQFMFAPLVLPGLVQTEEYAQAITKANGFVRRDRTDRFVSFRLARARRIADPEPLRLQVVIGEAALRLKVGTPELRRAQYAHLLELAVLPNVTLQVLRPEDGPHAAGTGEFVVLDFAEARSIAYSERLDGAVYVQDPDDVHTYMIAVENLQSVALPPDESAEWIGSLARAT